MISIRKLICSFLLHTYLIAYIYIVAHTLWLQIEDFAPFEVQWLNSAYCMP